MSPPHGDACWAGAVANGRVPTRRRAIPAVPAGTRGVELNLALPGRRVPPHQACGAPGPPGFGRVPDVASPVDASRGSVPQVPEGSYPLLRHPRPTFPRRIGRIEALAITLLAALVLASAGVPSIAVVAASDPGASPSPSVSPSASPAPSASPSTDPSGVPSPSASPSPSADASAAPSASSEPAGPSSSPDPSASASPGPSASASPVLAVAASVRVPTPTRTPPPGAVAAAALEGQPYSLPAFVALGAWRLSRVSFYGPGFYCVLNRVKTCLPQAGHSAWPNETACGVMYTRTVVGVAHRTLPCGSLVAFTYHGRTVVAPVIDRGPYVAGRDWDLSGGLCRALGHCFTGPIRWTIVHRASGPAAPLRIALQRL